MIAVHSYVYIAKAEIAVLRAHLAGCSQGALFSGGRLDKAQGKGSLRQRLNARRV